jgi:hypothetical protein
MFVSSFASSDETPGRVVCLADAFWISTVQKCWDSDFKREGWLVNNYSCTVKKIILPSVRLTFSASKIEWLNKLSSAGFSSTARARRQLR